MFEYLMPLLLMRSYPGDAARPDAAAARGARADRLRRASAACPWGISESAFNVVDRHGNYQYKAFGVPGPGPQARARATTWWSRRTRRRSPPWSIRRAAVREPRRLAREGAGGPLRLLRGDRLHAARGVRRADRATRRRPARAGAVVRAFFAHHQGMTPGGARQRAAATTAMVRPLPRRPARAGDRAAAPGARAAVRAGHAAAAGRGRRASRRRSLPPVAPRRFRSPHTLYPARAFLSNGRYVTVVTNAGGGASRCRGLAVTRWREDPTRDPGSQFLYLRDVRSGAVWSADLPADAQRARASTASRSCPTRRCSSGATTTSRRSSRSPSRRRTTSRCGGSRSPTAATGRARSRSRATPRSSSRRRPTTSPIRPSASCSSRPSTCPRRTALLCGRRPRSADEPGAVGGPRAQRRRAACRARSSGRPTARASSAAAAGPRTRSRSTAGRSRARPARCSIRSLSLRQRVRLAPGGFARLAFATGVAADREAALALAREVRTIRPRPRAPSRSPSRSSQIALRHLGISTRRGAALRAARVARALYRRLAARRRPSRWRANALGQPGLWAHGISGDLPILLVRVVEAGRPAARAPGAARAGVLAAQGPERRRRDPQRAPGELPRRDAGAARRAARERARGRAWKRPAGRRVPAARRRHDRRRARPAPRPRRARCCSGDRGDARRPARPALRRAALAAAARWPARTARAPIRRRTPADRGRVPPLDASQRTRRLHRDGREYVDRARRRPGDAAAVGQRHRQPALRHRRDGLGLGLHLGGEQPREPPHPVRQRSGRPSHRRGDLPARRRDRRGLGRDAGPAARDRATAAGSCATAPVSRATPTRAHGIAQELAVFVRRRRAGEVLAAHAHQSAPAAAAPQRLRLQRMGARPAAGRRAPARRHRARRRARGAVLARNPYNARVRRPRRLRARQRAPALGDRRPARVPRAQRLAAAARGARRARRSADASAPGSIRAPRCRSASSSRPGETRELVLPARPGRGPRRTRWSLVRALRLGVDGRDGRARRGRAALGRACSARSQVRDAGRLVRPDDEPLAALPGARAAGSGRAPASTSRAAPTASATSSRT